VEVIVVDDASSDETAEVCRSLPGIRWIRTERNQKVAGARNLGILASTGDYLSFLDDDDRRLPASLDIQLKALEAQPEAGLIYGQSLTEDHCGNITDDPVIPLQCPQGDVFWELLEWNFISCLTAVFRKECLYKVGLLDRGLAGFDDWDLWIRIAEVYPVAAVEEPVAIWRKASAGTEQGSSDLTNIFTDISRVYRERWLSLPRAVQAPVGKGEKAMKSFFRRAANVIVWEAADTLQAGQYGLTFKKLSAAFRLSPRSLCHLYTAKLFATRMFRLTPSKPSALTVTSAPGSND
jgi:glycosyltransferase involved in cell wall biosynthesis